MLGVCVVVGVVVVVVVVVPSRVLCRFGGGLGVIGLIRFSVLLSVRAM